MSFTPDGTFGAFTVVVGNTIDVPIYLTQNGSELRLNSNGLFSSGVTLNYTATSNAMITQAVLEFHWTDTDLNFASFNNTTGSGSAILEGLVINPPTDVVKPASGINFVRLGQVRFTSGLVGDVTNLSLSLTSENTDFVNLLDDGFGGIEVSPITFINGSITAVPEPTSLVGGLILSAVGLFSTRRNRWRKSKVLKPNSSTSTLS